VGARVSAEVQAGRTAGSAVLFVACVSTLVVNANTSAVSILLPSISRDTGSPIDTLQFAVTGYSMVGAAVIVTSGVLGDIFGRRKVFLLGLLLFVVSCVLIAVSDTGAGVIIGRCIQGAAGSTILACGLSLLSVASTGAEQMRAVTVWGAASAAGAAAGPLVGGVLDGVVGWQALFWLDAGVAALCIPLTLRSVQESNDPSRPRKVDYAGTALVAGVLVPLVLALSLGGSWGWGSVRTLGCLALSVVCGFAFVAVERRVTAPLVDLALLRNKILIGATAAILIVAATLNAVMFVLSIYFQNPDTLGFTALEAGLATLPATVGLIVVTPLVTRLATKYGVRNVIAGGFVLAAVGFAWLGFVEASWTYSAFVLPLIAAAVGMGFANGPASSIATSCVPAEDVGSASGISNMARYVGAAVGVAITSTVFTSVTDDRTAEGKSTADALADGLAASSVLLAVCSGAGVLLALLVARHRARPPQAVDYAAAAASAAHTLPTSPTAVSDVA
jgi:EmrB/QacA subfamily drug resistance transporter